MHVVHDARRGREDRRAPRKDVFMRRRGGDDVGIVGIYTSKKLESTEYEEMRKGKKRRRRRNAPIIRSQASYLQVVRCETRIAVG
jgi:hypothetical protein